MRSQKRKQRKYKMKYKQNGGSLFFDKIQAQFNDTLSNNPNYQSLASFISNPSFAITNMRDSLFTRATTFKDNLYSNAKARIQGVICSAGGTRKRSKRKRRRLQSLKS
jgi:23S rRNA A1618 N6-methylase RlmF